MRKTAILSFVAVVLGSIIGCGGPQKPADLPELYPCKITVIQDGQPLAGASVSLNDPASTHRFVMGFTTDAQGVAELRTDGKYKGVPAGKYKVLISKVFIPKADPNEVPPEDPEARKEYDKRMAELNDKQADTVDIKYKRPSTTPEEIEVTTAGAEATIDVGAKVEIPLNQTSGKY